MELIYPEVSLIKQENSIKGVFKHIELCARTCYKSEDKITEDSYIPLIKKLIEKKHWAMLEHGTVYITLSPDWIELAPNNSVRKVMNLVMNSNYTVKEYRHEPGIGEIKYLTTNLRVILEAHYKVNDEVPSFEELEAFMVIYADNNPTFEGNEETRKKSLEHKQRVTAKFIISRAIANEFVRHRVFSFAQESTRFVNYGNRRFQYIIPEWAKDVNQVYRYQIWVEALRLATMKYQQLIEEGLAPQFARGVLPLDLKTELVMTGTIDQWNQFMDMRLRGTTGTPHPDAKAIADELRKLLTD